MSAELKQLLAKLNRDASIAEEAVLAAQKTVDEIREKQRGVEMTIALLNSETPALSLNGSSFKGLALGDAVLECVNKFGGEGGLSRPEIVQYLTNHGFRYSGKAKHFYSSVSITANRLHALKDKIGCVTKCGVKRFIPKPISSEQK